MSKHMWPLKALKSGRSAVTLFEIRLENDFIVFRGSEHESAGQLLKGTVVLCLSNALKLDEVHLRLTGTLRLSFSQTKVSPSGISQHKVDKTVPILQHRWKPFIGGDSKPVVLQPGNYEFPFEYMLPGDTCETLEGIPEASISYRLKARVARSRLASDIQTYKHVRVIRTLEPSALEFLHAMSVENIWPNKVEYSIVVPQKAVVFGGTLPIEMRLTPLLKGLELGDIQARLLEIRECDVSREGSRSKEYRTEREAGRWKFNATEMNWHDAIEDTGQEGWVIEKKLDLPKRLRQCVQDITQHGVKIRHKVKLTIGLKNPDGHISELRATLPVSIFISPNIPLDEEGNLAPQTRTENLITSTEEVTAPPGYGAHVLDQLYADVGFTGFQTPETQSGTASPYYHASALGSSEDLSVPTPTDASTPEAMTALANRLQRMTDARSRRNSIVSLESSPGHSFRLSRPASSDGAVSPSEAEHVDEPDLTKVPSYATAVRTPARPLSTYAGARELPMYEDIESGAESADDRPSGSGMRSAALSRAPSFEGRQSGSRSRPRSGLSEALASRLRHLEQNLDSTHVAS